jgi:hypothetical protein
MPPLGALTGRPGDRWLVADHRVPPHRYRGTFADPANLWTLCKACNNSKGDRTVEEWRERMDQTGGRPGIYTARSIFTSSEADAAQELGRIRATVAAWRVADKAAWPVVGGPPNHGHHRWSARHMVSIEDATWDVCPPGCETPVRWRESL